MIRFCNLQMTSSDESSAESGGSPASDASSSASASSPPAKKLQKAASSDEEPAGKSSRPSTTRAPVSLFYSVLHGLDLNVLCKMFSSFVVQFQSNKDSDQSDSEASAASSRVRPSPSQPQPHAASSKSSSPASTPARSEDGDQTQKDNGQSDSDEGSAAGPKKTVTKTDLIFAKNASDSEGEQPAADDMEGLSQEERERRLYAMRQLSVSDDEGKLKQRRSYVSLFRGRKAAEHHDPRRTSQHSREFGRERSRLRKAAKFSQH